MLHALPEFDLPSNCHDTAEGLSPHAHAQVCLRMFVCLYAIVYVIYEAR